MTVATGQPASGGGFLIREFDEEAWDDAVYLIEAGDCTPFIGAGASAEYVPVAGDLAKALARRYHYPFKDTDDLARVTQFAAVQRRNRPLVKKRFVDEMIAKASVPDFNVADEPHALLADLELPIYITTNYDDFMFKALEHRKRGPELAICPWYTKGKRELEEATKLFSESAGYAADQAKPIVYHLHGHYGIPDSLVLTEDDYIDFLVRVSGDPDLLPPKIQESLSSKMLLFIGYSLEDWTFRVIFRGLLSARPPLDQYAHVSVQLPPEAKNSGDKRPLQIQEYLDKYFDRQNISICWMTAREFTTELRRRLGR
jgi:hypothetical protein